MQLVAIALGICAALFWGFADSLATLSVRRLTTFKTTLVSQIASLLVLNVLFIFIHTFNPSVTIDPSPGNVGAGILTGIFTFVAYLSIYRALEIGPVAITSPLSSASAIVTLLLSMFILHEHVSSLEAIALIAVMLGIILVSTNYHDILNLLQKKSSGFSVSKGMFWAYVAMLSLGCVFFGLGARTPVAGWFVPIYWARTFSVFLLCLTAFCTARRKGQMSLEARTPNTGWVAPAYRTHMFSVLLFCTSTFYMIRKRGPKGTLALLKRVVSLSEQQKGQMSLDARIPNTGWVASAYRTHMFSVLLFCTSTFYMIRKRGPKGTLALLKRVVSLSEQQKGQMSLDARIPNTGWVASAYRTHMFSVLLFCTSTFYMIRKRGPKGTLALLKRVVSLSEQQKGQMSLDARIPNTGWVASAYRTHMFSVLLFCTSTFYMIRKRGPKGTLALLKRVVSLSEQQKGQMSLDARIPNTGWVASAYRTHIFSVLLFCTSTFYMIRKRGPKGTLALLKRAVSLSEQQKGQMSLDARIPNTGWVASAYRTHMFSVLLFCTSTFYMIRKKRSKRHSSSFKEGRQFVRTAERTNEP